MTPTSVSQEGCMLSRYTNLGLNFSHPWLYYELTQNVANHSFSPRTFLNQILQKAVLVGPDHCTTSAYVQLMIAKTTERRGKYMTRGNKEVLI